MNIWRCGLEEVCCRPLSYEGITAVRLSVHLVRGVQIHVGGLGQRNVVSDVQWSYSVPNRRLQRINSQEELDFNETSSGSDRSELSGDDNFREMVLDHFVSPGLKRTFGRLVGCRRTSSSYRWLIIL